jgi:hypothetical protein
LGILQDFDLLLPVKSFNKKAKASEKNCEVPYSSEANKKEKLKLGVLGWKSNSIYVALTELMLIPDWDKIFF